MESLCSPYHLCPKLEIRSFAVRDVELRGVEERMLSGLARNQGSSEKAFGTKAMLLGSNLGPAAFSVWATHNKWKRIDASR